MKWRNKIHFDRSAQEVIGILFLAQLFLINGLYLLAGYLCFAFLFSRLQQPMKPSVFTIIFIFHFLQATAYIWLAIYDGKNINFQSPSMGKATLASLACFFFLFGPVIYYQNKIPNISLETLKRHALRLSIKKTFQAYIIAYFITNTLMVVALSLGGLAQIAFSLANVKWALFALFGFQATLTGKMKRVFYLVVLLEFATGFFSFFSNFKIVLFFTAFIHLTYITRVNVRHVVTTIVVIAVGLFLGIMWTGIKGEYRKFLNGGTNQQVVSVSQDEAMGKLFELTANQNQSTFDASVNDFLLRLQYTYHLGKTMDRVPSVIPYKNGANWGGTLAFVLTPRILNPNKGIYDATTKTMYYTGIRYSGQRSGSSFSLGYFADSYIDFGVQGMWFPLLMLGLLFGAIYFYFVRHSSTNFLINYSIVGAIFMEFTAFESDCTLILGRLLSNLVVFALLRMFVFHWFHKYISLDPVEVVSEVQKPVLTQ